MLRVVAVACVILSHAGLQMFGGYGVPFLVVLSSFFVTRIFIGSSAPTNFRDHFLRRFLRIGPAYYVFLVVTITIDFAMSSRWAATEVAAALTHTVNIANAYSHHSHPVAHAWTLSMLEQFYIAAFFLVPWFLARSSRALVLIVGAVTVAVILGRVGVRSAMPDSNAVIYNSLLLRLDMFFVGHVLARHYDEFVARVRTDWAALAGLFGAVAVIFVSKAWGPWHYTVGFTIEAAAAATLIVSVHRLAERVPWLDSPAWTRLAAFSYSAFLFQMWALAVADEVVSGVVARGSLGVVVAFAAGATVYHFVERPFLGLRSKLLHGRVSSPGSDTDLAASAPNLGSPTWSSSEGQPARPAVPAQAASRD
jgi:peptidoglycan/LPS O-acetylase OafA/YrhL